MRDISPVRPLLSLPFAIVPTNSALRRILNEPPSNPSFGDRAVVAAVSYTHLHCRLPVEGFRERELDDRANAIFGKAAAGVRQRISSLGKTVGSPWTQDEKAAALAGLMVCDKKH